MIENVIQALTDNRIVKILKVYREQLLALFGAAVIFVIGIYRYLEAYQPIIFSDEYGYWVSSAFFLGEDWKSVTEGINYYSYGYGIWLTVLRLIGKWFDWGGTVLFQSATVMHVLMLSVSYIIALKLCKRYFSDIHPGVRYLLCFAAIVYPSNLVFSHMTWAECTLTFFFWVFLLVLMKATDKPRIGNHIALALSAFYLYTIHQRTLAVLVTAVILVLYMELRRRNGWRHTVAFFCMTYGCLLVHSVIKGRLQNEYFLGRPPRDLKGILAYAFNMKMLLVLAVFCVLLALLYLCRRGKKKTALLLMAALGGAVLLLILKGGGISGDSSQPGNIAVNDFSGQIGRLKRIFTGKGIIRLGISIVGKWFYLASATALVVCWGIRDLLIHAFRMTIDAMKCAISVFTARPYVKRKVMAEKAPEDLWFFGVFLSFAGTFMISAIYKEGLYKVDDLVNGRYVEFLIGILIIYSFNSLIHSKRWILNALLYYVLYFLAAVLCQYTLNELGRTSFEICHSVMFGRVFWNNEVPVRKVRIMVHYVTRLYAAFLLIIRFKWFPRLRQVLYMAGLCIPIIVWTMLGHTLIDRYIIAGDELLGSTSQRLSFWVEALDEDIPVYFVAGTERYRWAESLQFMLLDRPVTVTDLESVNYDEEALFIIGSKYARTDEIHEKCEVVTTAGTFTLLLNRQAGAVENLRKLQGGGYDY